MKETLQKHCMQYAESFAELTGAACAVLDAATEEILWLEQAKPHFCQTCNHPNCTKNKTFLYGCSEAYRWNGKYIYFCPIGLTFVASSVSEEKGVFAGGLVSGPVLMDNAQTVLEDGLDNAQTVLEDGLDDAMKEQLAVLPLFSTKKVKCQEHILSGVTAQLSGQPHSLVGTFVYEQEKLLNDYYSNKAESEEGPKDPHFLIEKERQLRDMILRQDKTGAQKLLNEILGHIYFSSNANLKTVKSRILELVVILSRAAIDAGAEVNEVLLSNAEYIEKIESFQNMEDMNVWVTGILHQFIKRASDFTQVKHLDVVHRIMEYVKTNCSQKISLEDMAREVYLNRSYLSGLFKRETGQSLFSYVNHVRIEKSKILLFDTSIPLAEITTRCGFEDQGYFSKVFRKETGMSPKKYRDSKGCLPGAKASNKEKK